MQSMVQNYSFLPAVKLERVKIICLLFLCWFTCVFPSVDPVRSQEQEVSLYNDLTVNDVRHLQQFENDSKFEHQHTLRFRLSPTELSRLP